MKAIKEYLVSILALKPGEFQKRPRIYDALYLLHSIQLNLLKKFIEINLNGLRDLIILDIGCGEKPYMELFSHYASNYIGSDVSPRKGVDIVSSAEKIDMPDESCDVVLSLQMLEHVDDPNKSLDEIYRLLKNGGYIFISLPACFCYHPGIERYIPGKEAENTTYPDYWRWTQAGIKKLLSERYRYSSIEIEAIGGFFQTFGLQFAFLLSESAKSISRYLGYLVMFTCVPIINILSLFLDKICSKWNRLWSPYTVFIGYSVTLKK